MRECGADPGSCVGDGVDEVFGCMLDSWIEDWGEAEALEERMWVKAL